MSIDWPRKVYCHGFSLRKQALLREFLPGVVIETLTPLRRLPASSWMLLWGATERGPAWPPDIRIIRVEDGFLRSVGLGADLIRPVSWVFDSRGIYFDACCTSDLEYMLQEAELTPALMDRALALTQAVVTARLTKYNVGSTSWSRPSHAQRVILVPGQVETDASIGLGAPAIQRNLDLLKAVRSDCPDAYIVYKPHPDVVAGLRTKGSEDGSAARFCDEIVIDVPMADLIASVDEVHVMTSLTGFEALLRGRKVVCYGMPFYAGWGLTDDRLACPRRTRKRDLTAMVACVLILYPVYLSRSAPIRISPEQALQELTDWRNSSVSENGWQRSWRWALRKILSRP